MSLPESTLEFFETTNEFKDRDLFFAARQWSRGIGSMSTERQYQAHFMQWMKFLKLQLGRLPEFPDIENRKLLKEYKNALIKLHTADGESYPTSTAATKFSAALSFTRFCVADGYIEFDPTHQIGSIKFRESQTTDPLTEEQTADFFALLRAEAMEARGVSALYRCRQYFTLAFVLFSTGERIESVLPVTLGDFTNDPERPRLNFLTKGGKQENKHIHPETAELLQTWIEDKNLTDPKLPIFSGWGCKHSHLTYRSAAKYLKQAAERAGIKGFTPHRTRSTWITLAHYEGISGRRIQTQMGHKRYETTLRYLNRADELKEPTAHMIGFKKLLER